MLEDKDTREKLAHSSYSDMEELDFQIILKIHLIRVNNFFAYLVKEVRITKYGKNKELIPAFSPYEAETKKLFESRNIHASATALPTPEVKIIFTKAPFVQYEQILLDKNFKEYLETIMVSKRILGMGAQEIPIQKNHMKQMLFRTPLTLIF